MKTFNIDLYDYYKVKKPENGVGILTCYVIDNSPEVNPNRKQPAMLVVPGGGYCGCSFRESEPIALKYVSYGFSAFVITYSCSPVRYPYPLLEAVMAMQYLRDNADELHIDKDMIAAVGFSAGGHLCGMLGSYDKHEAVYNLFKHSDYVKPNAIVLGYPVITYEGRCHKGSFDNLCGDDESLKVKLSIQNLVNKNSAPAFIWSTNDDACVPIQNSLVVAKAYDDVGVKFSLHIFNSGIHGLSLADMSVYGTDYAVKVMTPSIPSWVDLSVEWLKEIGIFVK